MIIFGEQLRSGRRLGVFLVATMAALPLLCGCRTIGFYAQALNGHCSLTLRRQSIRKLVTDPATERRLRERLELVQELRDYAMEELQLPVDGHYEHYVHLDRPFVVWNVQAAPEFSLEAKTWWYPIVGSLDYRGYFSESGARRYADWLQQGGYDVYCGGASAYSTLGWFKDPVLSTFLFDGEAEVAETLFHELGHQVAFAKGDTDFNEAFATTVAEEATRRWLRSRRSPAALATYQESLARNRKFVALVMEARSRLEFIYNDQRDEDGNLRAPEQVPASPEVLRQKKEEVIAELKANYVVARLQWGGNPEYDLWFEEPITNAKLNSVANYYDLVPGFGRLLEINGGDLPAFYRDARLLAKGRREERHRQLRAMAAESGKPVPVAVVRNARYRR